MPYHANFLSMLSCMESVPYHSDKESKLWIEVHSITIREDKLFLPFLSCCQNDVDLLSSHRQHRQVNTVELIKTTP